MSHFQDEDPKCRALNVQDHSKVTYAEPIIRRVNELLHLPMGIFPEFTYGTDDSRGHGAVKFPELSYGRIRP